MKLKVPLHKQPKKSVLCGPYCVKMLMEYYGKECSIKDVARVYNKFGTYVADLATYLKQQGFDTVLYLPDTKKFQPLMRRKSRKEQIKHLKKLLKKTKKRADQRAIKVLLRWLEGGGKFKAAITDMAEVKAAIRKGHPVILTIDRKVLYGDKPGVSGHFVLATGYKKGKIILNDPHGKYGGIKAYPEKEILYALYSHNAPVIFVKP